MTKPLDKYTRQQHLSYEQDQVSWRHWYTGQFIGPLIWKVHNPHLLLLRASSYALIKTHAFTISPAYVLSHVG